MIRFFSLTIFTLFLSSGSHASGNCQAVRAVLDIGSANTKLIVARVDTCKEQLIKILEDQYIHVPYKESFLKSGDKTIDKKTQEKGLHALLKLKQEARKHSPTNYVAIVSSTIKRASNGGAFINFLEKSSKIQFLVIDEYQEAELGYLAARQNIKSGDERYVVWDIGAGSMKFTYLNDKEKLGHHLDNMASISFKNWVIEKVHRSHPANMKSPNPLGKESSQKALELVTEYARKTLPKELLKAVKNATLVGIGGVHFHNFQKLVREGRKFEKADLVRAIQKNFDKTDSEISGSYASTMVTNLILVLGYLQALEAKEIISIKSNMTHGLLVHPKYW